jgi:hypothetical protein
LPGGDRRSELIDCPFDVACEHAEALDRVELQPIGDRPLSRIRGNPMSWRQRRSLAWCDSGWLDVDRAQPVVWATPAAIVAHRRSPDEMGRCNFEFGIDTPTTTSSSIRRKEPQLVGAQVQPFVAPVRTIVTWALIAFEWASESGDVAYRHYTPEPRVVRVGAVVPTRAGP